MDQSEKAIWLKDSCVSEEGLLREGGREQVG